MVDVVGRKERGPSFVIYALVTLCPLSSPTPPPLSFKTSSQDDPFGLNDVGDMSKWTPAPPRTVYALLRTTLVQLVHVDPCDPQMRQIAMRYAPLRNLLPQALHLLLRPTLISSLRPHRPPSVTGPANPHHHITPTLNLNFRVRRLSHYLVWITSATPGSGHDTMKADTFNVHAQGLGPPDLWLADAVAHIHAKLRQMRKLVFGDNLTVVAFGRPTKPQRPGSNRSNRAESEEPVGDTADKAMAELEVNVSCEPSTSA